MLERLAEAESTAVAAFPSEVFEEIFHYLSPIELSRLGQTCRSFYHLSTRSSVWERIYLAFWREGDERKDTEQEVRRLRGRRRLSELREAAHLAWLPDSRSIKKNEGNEEHQHACPPFPLALSGEGKSHADGPSTKEETVFHFYSLFLERIKIDGDVLGNICSQCESSTRWLSRAEGLVVKYGNDAKDVLHALMACQSRQNDDELISYEDSSPLDWPTALQLRLPSTKPSRSHRLSLWHYGRELLEHLQRREAMQGLLSLRRGHKGLSMGRTWTDMQSQDVGDYTNLSSNLEARVRRAKLFENGLSWLSMYRGGEGQEIAEELDVLAVSCALHLASRDISLHRGAMRVAEGIIDFMKSRSFHGASPTNFSNLDNNFLHLCLDESGRETLPMTIVVIFCSIASRLGLSALPTDTPARILAVVDGFAASASDVDATSSDRFWIDVFGGGVIMSYGQVERLLQNMRLPMIDAHHAPSDPSNLCLRSARNIFNSVQNAHGVPRFSSGAANEENDWNDGRPVRSEGSEQHPAEVFERTVMSSEFLFNPRRTHMTPQGPKVNLPFWPTLDKTRRSRLRHTHANIDFDRQASMYAAANALTRIDGRLGERNSVWSASLLQDCFQLDSLTVRNEFLDETLRSPLYEEEEDAREALISLFDSLSEDDAKGPTILGRSHLEQRDAIHPAGTLFVHRQQGYKAAIMSWDDTCKASEDWINAMRVDTLPNGGRHQPFYHSTVADGSSRYVAHCNILPAAPSTAHSGGSTSFPAPAVMTRAEVEQVLCQRGIGLNFRQVSLHANRLRLVKNARGQRAFPDDDDYE